MRFDRRAVELARDLPLSESLVDLEMAFDLVD